MELIGSELGKRYPFSKEIILLSQCRRMSKSSAGRQEKGGNSIISGGNASHHLGAASSTWCLGEVTRDEARKLAETRF